MDNIFVTIVGVSILVGLSPVLVEATSVNQNSVDMNASIHILNQTARQGGNLSLGVNANQNLNYGRAPINVSTTKIINITADESVYLKIDSSGNISDILYYDEYQYFNGTKQVNLRARSKEPGNYSGTVVFKTMTPRNILGERWLQLKKERLLSF